MTPPPRAMAAVPYLHQVGRHHAPGPHHVQERAGLVPHDAEHGLSQPEEVQGTAAVLGGLRLPFKSESAAILTLLSQSSS